MSSEGSRRKLVEIYHMARVGRLRTRYGQHVLQPGEGGPPTGAVEPLALTDHLQVAPNFGAASVNPSTATGGSNLKVSASAEGY